MEYNNDKSGDDNIDKSAHNNSVMDNDAGRIDNVLSTDNDNLSAHNDSVMDDDCDDKSGDDDKRNNNTT